MMCKQIIAVFLIALITTTQADATNLSRPPKTRTIKVPRRAGLKFVTLKPLNSATAKVGDDVPLKLARSLVINNVTVLPAGEIVHGRVTKVMRAGPNCKYGGVAWKLNTVPFPDGSRAKTKLRGVGIHEVPERLFADYYQGDSLWPAIDEWWEVVLALPIYSVVTVLFAVLLPFNLLALAGVRSSCKTPGKELTLAPGTPVAVEITRTTRVRY